MLKLLSRLLNALDSIRAWFQSAVQWLNKLLSTLTGKQG